MSSYSRLYANSSDNFVYPFIVQFETSSLRMNSERHDNSDTGSLLDLLKTVDGLPELTLKGRQTIYETVR